MGEETYRVFHHLAAPKASSYRNILRMFMSAKERFEISLRPLDLLMLAHDLENCSEELLTEEGITTCVEALCSWGNLAATREIVSAKTLDEYLHPKYFYQLTQAGEQAERALASFEDSLALPGELSALALREIGDALDELFRLLSLPTLDNAKAAKVMEDLASRFDSLVSRAQMFMGGLQRELDRPAGDELAFLALKEELLGYLERFVKELLSSTYRIRHSLERFSEPDVEMLLAACVDRDLAETLGVTEQLRQRAFSRWLNRWNGLRGWFIGQPEHPAQSERLRQRAREAIPTLLERVRRMHDQRANRMDRSTDFLTLARWFADAPDEPSMHQLWRAAFALNPARHLRVNETTLHAWAGLEEGRRLTWEEAPPYIITISQWTRGSSARLGKAPAVIDRTAAREALRARAEAEARALRDARNALADQTPCALADLIVLTAPGFEVLLDAISEAFASMKPSDHEGEANTADGELTVRLRLPASRQELVGISTPEGLLRGPNIRLTLRLADEPLTQK